MLKPFLEAISLLMVVAVMTTAIPVMDPFDSNIYLYPIPGAMSRSYREYEPIEERSSDLLPYLKNLPFDDAFISSHDLRNQYAQDIQARRENSFNYEEPIPGAFIVSAPVNGGFFQSLPSLTVNPIQQSNTSIVNKEDGIQSNMSVTQKEDDIQSRSRYMLQTELLFVPVQFYDSYPSTFYDTIF